MNIVEKLGLKLPLIQAPLDAYPKQIPFIATICKQGALGVYSTNLQLLATIKDDIAQLVSANVSPFAVLVNMADSSENIDLADRSVTDTYLKKAYQTLNIDASDTPELPDAEAICKAVINTQPPVIIFQNGLPNDAFIETCKRKHITTFTIASNILEVIAIEHSPIDAIILQGSESAGLLSQFDNGLDIPYYPISSLLQHARKNSTKPLAVWGHYQHPTDINTAIYSGAQAVVLDTPFWTTHESSIPSSYRQALQQHNEMSITTSLIWQGHPSQVIKTALTQSIKDNRQQILSSRKQQRIMQPIIKAAIEQNQEDYLPLWAGLFSAYSDCSVADLCRRFTNDIRPLPTFSLYD